ncbi:hypothetical protein [Hominifimenecus sp. rT4P-3]|uniref:hypothetical protein n=1 Tax=Hominifimenecus sp. rT4P-3 TaxID=3242979 RepID=UPI003DA2B837
MFKRWGKRFRQIGAVAAYNFRQWHKNPRIIITFLLAFILCFLLSDKAVNFAKEHDTVMQVVEPFIWTFGDSNSILLSSLLLLLLFADMPFLSAGTPFYLMRIDRKTWVMGQAFYIVLATGIYLAFILAATSLVCMTNAFSANMWSKTAAILGYSGEGEAIALPALVKTLEMSKPYSCMATIFLLMLLYTLVMVFLMLFFHIWKGQAAGVIAVFAFSVTGFLLNPENLKNLFRLPDELAYKARVWVGWLSPLNQATYHMHNFGYDRLPRLWQTYLIFGGLLVFLMILSLWAIRRYSFHFRGTEN